MENTIMGNLEPQTIPKPPQWNFKINKLAILQKTMPYTNT